MMLTCKDNHVHAPEYAHNPAHHDHGGEDLDEGSSDVQPEHAAHVPTRQIRPGAAQHREGRDESTCPFGCTENTQNVKEMLLRRYSRYLS